MQVITQVFWAELLLTQMAAIKYIPSHFKTLSCLHSCSFYTKKNSALNSEGREKHPKATRLTKKSIVFQQQPAEKQREQGNVARLSLANQNSSVVRECVKIVDNRPDKKAPLSSNQV